MGGRYHLCATWSGFEYVTSVCAGRLLRIRLTWSGATADNGRENLDCLRDRDERPHNRTRRHCHADEDLARRLIIPRSDGITHQKLLDELSDVDLFVMDEILTV